MRLILASNSPRRRQLLTDMGLAYEIRLREVAEDFPPPPAPGRNCRVPGPATRPRPTAPTWPPDELLLTADTIVCLGDDVLNKPADRRRGSPEC